MAADIQRTGPAGHWTVNVRLVIEADDADTARTMNDHVLQGMGVLAKTEPDLTDFFVDSPKPCWYVFTELDLSGLESIAPDDAATVFEFVVRERPSAVFVGHGSRHTGAWEWLPDSQEPASPRLSPDPAVRAASIFVFDRPASLLWRGGR